MQNFANFDAMNKENIYSEREYISLSILLDRQFVLYYNLQDTCSKILDHVYRNNNKQIKYLNGPLL